MSNYIEIVHVDEAVEVECLEAPMAFQNLVRQRGKENPAGVLLLDSDDPYLRETVRVMRMIKYYPCKTMKPTEMLMFRNRKRYNNEVARLKKIGDKCSFIRTRVTVSRSTAMLLIPNY